MEFTIDRSVEILSATPAAFRALLANLSDTWTGREIPDAASESQDRGWEAYDIIGHLIHAEETDWIPRARIILDQQGDRKFVPFDRFAQFENSKGKSLADLLEEFALIRSKNLDTLQSWKLVDDQLDLQGMHPELGAVTLRQLLATWVVHDLTHIRQTVTVIAAKYSDEVGVWKEYLSILK